MLYLNDVDQIGSVTVYGDDKNYNVFYLLPEQPRYRVDDEGRPIFKFLKYRTPIDRGEGKAGGGYVVFDVEFSIPEEEMEAIKEKLERRIERKANELGDRNPPELQIGTINFNKGVAQLNIANEDNDFVEKVFHASTPSLYGKNISVYSLELTPQGATLFEQALQGKGGFVQIIYHLYFDAKLPPLTVTGNFTADVYYDFLHEIDVEERWCKEDDYTEVIEETLTRSQSREVDIKKGSSQVSQESIDEIVRAANQFLADGVEQAMIDALPIENVEDARKWYAEKDIEDVKREVTRSRTSNLNFTWTEETVIEVHRIPQGTLPNITNLVDNNGDPVLWEDYALEIDLDDPFFQQINVAVSVNASFEDLPIHSVEVKLDYDDEPMNVLDSPIDGEFQFTSPNDVARFASFLKEDLHEYKYSYQVNYKGESRQFQSEEIDSKDTRLTINVDDMGILLVDVKARDIKFNQVESVHVLFKYEDPANQVDLIEKQFILDEANPSFKIQELIFSKREKEYEYTTKYFMKDGKEFVGEPKVGNANTLYIDDPFSAIKTIGIRAAGDLDKVIETIYVDFKYFEKSNKYEQLISVALHRKLPFFNWKFPVINPLEGEVSYSYSIVYKDGTIQEFEEQNTTSSTPIIGEIFEDNMSVLILTDLLDLDEIKLVRVELEYADPDNGVLEREDFIFSKGRKKEQMWTINLKDEDAVKYSYKATYFLENGDMRSVEEERSDLTLILRLPS